MRRGEFRVLLRSTLVVSGNLEALPWRIPSWMRPPVPLGHCFVWLTGSLDFGGLPVVIFGYRLLVHRRFRLRGHLAGCSLNFSNSHELESPTRIIITLSCPAIFIRILLSPVTQL